MSKRKRNIRIAVGIIAAYAAVIVLLLIAESGAPDSSINSVGDAIWYSIITLTTVGYGDISPVTPVGKVLGVILALCSLGLLTALMGILLSFISGQAMPRMRLKASRNSKWYVFNEMSEYSAALAESVLNEDPDARIVFCEPGEKRISVRQIIYPDCIPEDLIYLKGGSSDIMFFCLGNDSWKSFRRAQASAAAGIETYCVTEFGPEEISGNPYFFSRMEIVSRCYWRDHPLQRNERDVVIIGSGNIAARLLETGLTTNVFEAGRYITYHVFGDPEGFCKSHPVIVRTLGNGDPGDDSLILYEGSWENKPEIIRNADRIIICENDDKTVLGIYKELRTFFPTAAAVHVRLDSDIEQIEGFGSCSKTFTLRSIVREDINRRAVTLNEIYSEGQSKHRGWNDLSDHLKRSNIAAADHMIVKVRYLLRDDSITELTKEDCRRAYSVFSGADESVRDACREMEHRRWMRFHQMYNWEYAPVRDDLMRRHPLIVPYDQLSKEEKEVDDYAWEMLGLVAER